MFLSSPNTRLEEFYPASLERRDRVESRPPNPQLHSIPRATLEPLKDRCLPSANMMMPMSMPMPPMNMQPMGLITPSDRINPHTLAAITQLFSDFDQKLQQVRASTTMQQFIPNEAQVIQVPAADLTQFRMSGAPMGRRHGHVGEAEWISDSSKAEWIVALTSTGDTVASDETCRSSNSASGATQPR